MLRDIELISKVRFLVTRVIENICLSFFFFKSRVLKPKIRYLMLTKMG